MKKLVFIILILLSFSTMLQAQVARTINVTAGKLYTSLTEQERITITSLTLTGTIDARDFRTMRDNMPLLAELNLSAVTIAGYIGSDGCNEADNFTHTYPANSLPDYSFGGSHFSYGGKSLKTMYLPTSVTSIGNNVFASCTALTSVAIPSSLRSIGNNAFSQCTGLTSIDLPSSLISIGNYAFYGCSGLTSVTIPSTVTSLGDYSFSRCTKINSIYINTLLPTNIKSSLTSFDNIDKTTTVLNVPSGSKIAYQNAAPWSSFTNIVEMPEIYLSTYFLDMNESAGTLNLSISSSSDWTITSDKEWLTFSAGSGGNGNTIIQLIATSNPDTTNRKAIITVSANGVESKTAILTQYGKLYLKPGSLKARLAEELSKITNLTLTGTIDARDFKTIRDDMPLLAVLDLSAVNIAEYQGSEGTSTGTGQNYPANTLPEDAFFTGQTGKTTLTTIILPSSLTSLGVSAFKQCNGIKAISIPSSVTTLGQEAFYECKALTSVMISSSVVDLGISTFLRCTAINSITVPSSVTIIGANAFMECTGLSLITLPSVTTIGGGAFYGCTGLSSITLSSSLTTIGGSAFKGCTGLTTVDLPSSIVSIGTKAFENCKALTSVIIPPLVTQISDYTFTRCLALTSVTLPSSITSIGLNAFIYCDNLLSINLPYAVSSVGDAAFIYCSKLTSFTVNNPIPPTYPHFSQNPIINFNSVGCTLYVPYGTKAVYEAADGWRYFKNIVESTTGYVVVPNAIKMASAKNSSSIDLTTNVNWTAASDQSWLTISPASGTGVNQKLTITAEPNPSVIQRTATITVSSAGFESQTVSVTQFGSNLTLNISPGQLATALTDEELKGITHLTLTGSMDARDFKIIRDNMPLLMDLDIKEVTVVSYKGPDGTRGANAYNDVYAANTIPYSAFDNRSIASIILPRTIVDIDRCFTFGLKSLTVDLPVPIVFRSTDDALLGALGCMLNVPYGTASLYKAAEGWKNFSPIVEASQGFVASSYSVNLAGEEGSKGTVELKSTIDWTVSSDQDWLTVSPASGNSTQTILFTAKANPLFEKRKANITLTGTGVSPQTITITQDFQIQPLKTLEVTAGSLSTILTTDELNTISKLTLTGTIDARDFKTMRDKMPVLAELNLSGATIVAYTGTEGTSIWGNKNYPVNEFPESAFVFKDPWGGPNSGKASLTSVILPTSLTSLGNYAFAYCKNLTNITIPSSVTTIGEFAFYDCQSLTYVSIPSFVTSVRSDAFYGCTKLTAITVNWNTPVALSSLYPVFSMETRDAAILNVPYGTIPKYSTAFQWKDFKNIKEMPGFMPLAFVAEIEAKQGSTASVTINSDVPWIASSDQTWLTVGPTNGTGVGQKITFTAEANTSYSPRVAKVTVSSPDKESQIITVTQSASPAKVDITAGGLASAFTEEELKTIKDLTITGTIDARDFKTMRDKMPLLAKVDISAVTIVAYNGNEGTSSYRSSYHANTIPETAFYNKSSLISLLLPKSITTVEREAFSQCNGLTTIVIPEGVTKIDNNGFYKCKGLQTVTLPASIVTLGSQCFSGGSNLTSLTVESSIPPDLLSSYDVFYLVDKSKCVLNVPYASKQKYRSAYQWEMFGNITEAANGFSIGSNKETVAGTAGSIVTVTVSANIAWSASSDQEWLTVDPSSGSGNQSITFTAQANPSFTVTRTAIVTVSTTVPGMPSQKITITQNIHPQPPKTLELTPGGLVSALTADELATVTDLTITGTIDARDFKTMRDRMPLLTQINLSKAIIVAYNGTDGTSTTGNTDYPANTLPERAFGSKTYSTLGKNLTSVILPESITAIGPHAFAQCKYLDNVIIPSSVTIIGEYAFYGCTIFSDITVPVAVTSMGILAFGGLDYCTIEVDAGNPNYMSSNNVLFNKAQTELIQCVYSKSGNYEIPSSVKTISPYAFFDRPYLTNVIIPSSVISIGNYAFYHCFQLTTLNIPSSVNFIGEAAFAHCYLLESIYANSVIPINLDASPDVFSQVMGRTLFVPIGSKTAYQTANQWEVFWNIIENNTDLIASAGPDKQTEEGKMVILEGSVLTNTSGKPLTYQWTAPSGIILSSATDLRPSFMAPKVTFDETYTFSLIVSDGLNYSLPDEVVVKVKNVNKIPVANAGSDQTINENSLVTLDGSASYDPDNNSLFYKWTTSSEIILSTTSEIKSTFTAPEVAKDTVFTFSLMVADSYNYTTDVVSITVKNINKAPIANSGINQEVNEGTVVSLDGSNSYDSENDVLSYQWTAPSVIKLSSNTESKPSFTAPEVTADSNLIFSLIVSDGFSYSLADEVYIKVKNINMAPVANAENEVYTSEGASVTLDATSSTDQDGDPLTYLWTAPEGISLSSATVAMPTFTAPEVQSDTWLTFSLVVSDGKLSSSPSEVKVMIRQIDPILGLISKADFLTNPVRVNYRLYKKEDNSFLLKIDTLSTMGDSIFIHLEPGEWTVLVSPEDGDPFTFIPTYAGDVTNWDEAEIINVPDKSTVVKVINCLMIPMEKTGIGQVAGFVYEKPDDETKSISIIREENQATGNPVQTALVQLYKKGSTIPVTCIFTDSQGYYKFDKLQIADYEINVEIPGYVQSERFPFTLSNTAPVSKIWFAVNTSAKVITDNNGIQSLMLKVYPNPTTGIVHLNGLPIKAKIAVYTMDGKLILKKDTKLPDEIINISRQVSGTYVFVINKQRFKIYKK